MYPHRELAALARLREARIHSIEQRRRAHCTRLRHAVSPLRLLDWAVSEWRATEFPATLAMLPVESFLRSSEPDRLVSAQRLLRSALVVLAAARHLDRIVATQTTTPISE